MCLNEVIAHILRSGLYNTSPLSGTFHTNPLACCIFFTKRKQPLLAGVLYFSTFKPHDVIVALSSSTGEVLGTVFNTTVNFNNEHGLYFFDGRIYFGHTNRDTR